MTFIFLSPKKSLPCLLLAFSFLISCKHHRKPSPSGFADESFSDKIESILKPIDTTDEQKIRNTSGDVRYTYQVDDYQPIWVKENYMPDDASEKLIADLEDIQWDGLDPERYNLSVIKKIKAKLDTGKNNSVEDAVLFDTLLTHSYLAAAHDLLMGYISPKSVDTLWFHINDTVWNAPHLLVDLGKYTSLDEYRSYIPTYTLLRNEYKRLYNLEKDTAFNQTIAAIHPVKNLSSEQKDAINTLIKTQFPWIETTPNDTMSEETQLIRTYQKYTGLKPTGKLDSITYARMALPPAFYLKQLRCNMERLRWMQQKLGDLYLIVDIPLMELFLRKQGANVQHMNVVVGKRERQTPSLFAIMSNIVINPPWGVPPTILKQDVIPGFAKTGNNYLVQKGLKAYDKKGNEVNASHLTLKNLKNFTIKQDPGDDNSLGYVKFNLPNPWDIYLHDTPHRGDFDKTYRALSSGCIRLQHPQEMAVYILSELEQKRYNPERLDSIIATHKTRWEVLRTRVPVHIVYLTAFEDTTGQHVQFTKDIYHRDSALISLLK